MKQIHLAAHFPGVNNTTVWSDPTSGSQTDFSSFVHLAQTAERGKFDFFFLAEGLRLREHRGRIFDLDVVGRPDSLTVLAALAAVTDRIGLAATLNTTFNEPYELARQFATLDHLSNGRAAWNAVTSPDAFTGENFRRGGFLDRDDRYERAEEFIEVARAAVGQLGATGDATGVFDGHAPHRRPVHDRAGRSTCRAARRATRCMIQAGDSDGGRELAAKHADVIFSRHSGFADGQAFYADVKRRLARVRPAPRRPQDHPRRHRGRRRHRRRGRRTSPLHIRTSRSARRARSRSSSRSGDATCPATTPTARCPTSIPTSTAALTITRGRVRHDKDPLAVASKWRAIAEAEEPEHPPARHRDDRAVGVRRAARRPWPTTINDYVQADAADGYILVPHLTPHGLDRFVDDVVPMLQERGVFRADYEGPTLRDHLGLPGPYATPAFDASPGDSTARPLEVALIGAGPTASSLLERLAANAARAARPTALRIHLVDPHRAGTGRVWRPDLSTRCCG